MDSSNTMHPDLATIFACYITRNARTGSCRARDGQLSVDPAVRADRHAVGGLLPEVLEEDVC